MLEVKCKDVFHDSIALRYKMMTNRVNKRSTFKAKICIIRRKVLICKEILGNGLENSGENRKCDRNKSMNHFNSMIFHFDSNDVKRLTLLFAESHSLVF